MENLCNGPMSTYCQVYWDAIDNHRSLSDKHGSAGKRDLLSEDDIKTGNILRALADDNVVRTLIEFLTYLHLKESGVLESLTSSVSSEESIQS
ncbi:galanin peptides isoform X1 [Pelobates cultripes]|uniref:Galanin peptides n=1 Tax=Pelobates cultripes TaxID=61616 RepID=A0AAD1W981_PELCU|nr:galanin peptides isoform X1 [Pelobates cultripes]